MTAPGDGCCPQPCLVCGEAVDPSTHPVQSIADLFNEIIVPAICNRCLCCPRCQSRDIELLVAVAVNGGRTSGDRYYIRCPKCTVVWPGTKSGIGAFSAELMQRARQVAEARQSVPVKPCGKRAPSPDDCDACPSKPLCDTISSVGVDRQAGDGSPEHESPPGDSDSDPRWN